MSPSGAFRPPDFFFSFLPTVFAGWWPCAVGHCSLYLRRAARRPVLDAAAEEKLLAKHNDARVPYPVDLLAEKRLRHLRSVFQAVTSRAHSARVRGNRGLRARSAGRHFTALAMPFDRSYTCSVTCPRIRARRQNAREASETTARPRNTQPAHKGACVRGLARQQGGGARQWDGRQQWAQWRRTEFIPVPASRSPCWLATPAAGPC